VPQDYSEAIRWYRKAADQGDATAQYVIGYMYDHGKGAPRDHAEAMRWYRKAGKQGDVKARRALREPLSTSMKVLIAIDFLGTMLLLIASYGEARKASGPQQLAAVIKELLSLTYLVLSCASLFHVGIAYTSPFRITRDLLRGMVFAMLIPIVRPQSEEFMLKLSGILFVGFNLYAITHYDLRYSGPAVRIFHLTNALLIGIASASATALWLAAKKDQRITEAQQPGSPTFPQGS
jgi:Sel1 repeat